MRIREEDKNDHETISGVYYAAFLNHPQHAPGAEPTEHLIVERLREAGALSLALVAGEDGRIEGHIAFSPVAVGEAETGWFLLGPVGVLPECQKTGIGSALIREGLTLLRERGAAGVVLVGDPGYYGRFGFAAKKGLSWKGVPEQYVLALCFTNERPIGEIACHAAFGC